MTSILRPRLRLGAEAAAPPGADVGEQRRRDHALAARARVRLYRPDHHAARERRDRVEPLARRELPAELVVHREPEGECCRQVNDAPPVSAGLVAARGGFPAIVAVGRVGAAAAAAANLRELAGAAASAELRIAQGAEDRRRAPEGGEARAAEGSR